MSATTFQLFQRLARKLFGTDCDRLTLGQAEDLRDAINKGMDEFGSFLPPHRKVRDEMFVIEAPKTVSVTTTNASKTITFGTALPLGAYATTADLVGRGIILAGAPQVNRLIASTKLLQPFLGTSGATAGTLYADGIPMPGKAEMVAGGEVTFLRAGSAEFMPLTFEAAGVRRSNPEVGDPKTWWVEPFGGSEAQEVSWLVRVWPLPANVGLLNVRLKCWALPVTMNDMNVTTRDLPVDDSELGFLVSLCADRGLDCRDLDPDVPREDIRAEAATVRRQLDNRANPNPSGQQNKVGTPPGW